MLFNSENPFHRSQVYFKATASKGAWTTYFRSFILEVWIAYGVSIAGAIGVMVLINQLASSRTSSTMCQRLDFLGACFIIAGTICQQGKLPSDTQSYITYIFKKSTLLHTVCIT